jgi:7-keto-8-aminopelargonate synthetase-like enzyme
VLRRELAFVADQAGIQGGDWWHLILDPSEPGFWVEHTWRRISPVTGETTDTGIARFGINDFLTLAQEQPAHPALLAALGEIFQPTKASPTAVSGNTSEPTVTG